jgi:hypothetical protein
MKLHEQKKTGTKQEQKIRGKRVIKKPNKKRRKARFSSR